jgi:hypothetical protein
MSNDISKRAFAEAGSSQSLSLLKKASLVIGGVLAGTARDWVGPAEGVAERRRTAAKRLQP